MQDLHPEFGIEIPVFILSILSILLHGVLAIGAIVHIIKSWRKFEVCNL